VFDTLEGETIFIEVNNHTKFIFCHYICKCHGIAILYLGHTGGKKSATFPKRNCCCDPGFNLTIWQILSYWQKGGEINFETLKKNEIHVEILEIRTLYERVLHLEGGAAA
jgi:hypothetical protein